MKPTTLIEISLGVSVALNIGQFIWSITKSILLKDLARLIKEHQKLTDHD